MSAQLHALLRVAEGADMPVEGVGHIGMRQARDAQALALAFPALLLGISVDPLRSSPSKATRSCTGARRASPERSRYSAGSGMAARQCLCRTDVPAES